MRRWTARRQSLSCSSRRCRSSLTRTSRRPYRRCLTRSSGRTRPRKGESGAARMLPTATTRMTPRSRLKMMTERRWRRRSCWERSSLPCPSQTSSKPPAAPGRQGRIHGLLRPAAPARPAGSLTKLPSLRIMRMVARRSCSPMPRGRQMTPRPARPPRTRSSRTRGWSARRTGARAASSAPAGGARVSNTSFATSRGRSAPRSTRLST